MKIQRKLKFSQAQLRHGILWRKIWLCLLCSFSCLLCNGEDVKIEYISNFDFNHFVCLQVTNTTNRPVKGVGLLATYYKMNWFFLYAAGADGFLEPGESRILGGEWIYYDREKRVLLNDKRIVFLDSRLPVYERKLRKNDSDDKRYRVVSKATLFAESGDKEGKLVLLPEKNINLYKGISSGMVYKGDYRKRMADRRPDHFVYKGVYERDSDKKYEPPKKASPKKEPLFHYRGGREQVNYMQYEFNHTIVKGDGKDGVEYAFLFCDKRGALKCRNYNKFFLEGDGNVLFELQVTFPSGVSLSKLLHVLEGKYGKGKEAFFTEKTFHEMGSDRGRKVLKQAIAKKYKSYIFENDELLIQVYGDDFPVEVSFLPLEDKMAKVTFWACYEYWGHVDLTTQQKKDFIELLKNKKAENCYMHITDKVRLKNILSVVEALKKDEKNNAEIYDKLLKKIKENQVDNSLDF